MFFTLSSIWKCCFLNHMQHLNDMTISSILFALLHYIIHVRFQRLPSLSSTALVELHGVHPTNTNVRYCMFAMKYFTIIVFFFAIKVASCHWQCYVFCRFVRGHIFSKGCLDPPCLIIGRSIIVCVLIF